MPSMNTEQGLDSEQIEDEDEDQDDHEDEVHDHDDDKNCLIYI